MPRTKVVFVGERSIIVEDDIDHEQIARRLQDNGFWKTTQVGPDVDTPTSMTLMRAGVASLYPVDDTDDSKA